jgi:general secretion pathway protein C
MTLLVWAAVLAGAVAWGLPLFTRSTPVPAGASLAAPAPPAGANLARLLGQPPAQPEIAVAEVPADSRFRLLGVVAPRPGRASGLALISVDGKPARAVGVGRELEPGLRVLTVAHRQVELGAGGGAPSVTLSLPPLAEAQRGRPGDQAGMPGAQPGMPGLPPGMPTSFTSNGLPGGMRVAPVRVPQGVPQNAGMADGSPGSLPSQPDGTTEPTPPETGTNRLR